MTTPSASAPASGDIAQPSPIGSGSAADTPSPSPTGTAPAVESASPTPAGTGTVSGAAPSSPNVSDSPGTASDVPSTGPAASSPQEKPPAGTTEASLVAVGDIMSHAPQLPGYYDAATRTYDFKPWFRYVKPLLSKGDWVVANLETPLAGADLTYTGYPRFNAPDELADALKDAGFGILTTANNHTLDRGYVGIARTLATLRSKGLVPVGTSVSRYDSQRLTIVEKNGIKLGFLAYTYGTNGIPIPKDHPYAVNLIDLSKITDDIKRLREAGADAVAVSLHFGIEYQRMPNDDQKDIARSVVAAGADLVLGSHPHVVQPYETIEVPDPTSPDGIRRGFVIYSMGNFVSNQHDNWKDVGVIVSLKLTKTTGPDGSGRTVWSDVKTTPTWVRIGQKGKNSTYTVYPIAQTLANRDDPDLTDADYKRMSTYLTGLNRHLKSLAPKQSAAG
nr:CapA family protein [Cohnella zeiphila]